MYKIKEFVGKVSLILLQIMILKISTIAIAPTLDLFFFLFSFFSFLDLPTSNLEERAIKFCPKFKILYFYILIFFYQAPIKLNPCPPKWGEHKSIT